MAGPPKGVKTVGKAVGDRLMGEGPGPIRAAVAAAITGGATAALTYHFLRHTGENA